MKISCLAAAFGVVVIAAGSPGSAQIAIPAPMIAPTSTPIPDFREINAQRLTCRTAQPAEIGDSTIVIAEKQHSSDFGVIFEKVQQYVNRDTGFFNTAVSTDEITIDLRGPVVSALVPHSPNYWTDAQGSIRFLKAAGCGREYIGFSPRIHFVRVGVTTQLGASEPHAVSDAYDAVAKAIRASLRSYCGDGRSSIDLEGRVITCH